MTIKAILQGFTICSSFYGARFQTPSDPRELQLMASLWADALSDIGDEIGVAAFRQHGRVSDRPPTPADIIKAVAPELPGAGVAWGAAMDAARRIGYQEGTVPDLGSPEAMAAARAVGWHAICFAGSEHELSFTRSHFFRIYDDLVTRSERERNRTQISGSVPSGLLPKMKRVSEAIGSGPSATAVPTRADCREEES
jgi:hypothetical protein